jgi:hypothetical protein
MPSRDELLTTPSSRCAMVGPFGTASDIDVHSGSPHNEMRVPAGVQQSANNGSWRGNMGRDPGAGTARSQPVRWLLTVWWNLPIFTSI